MSMSTKAKARAGVLVCAALIWFAAALPSRGQVAGPGQTIGDFKLEDTAGKTHSLASYKGKIVVLAFWSFKCPVALSYDAPLAALQEKYAGRGIVVLGVDSNSNETSAEIERNVRNLNLAFPMLLDSDGVLAERVGATITPTVFVLDGQGVIRYKGSLGNLRKPGDSKREAFAEDAIDAILAGKAVAVPETKVNGCSMKRK